MGLSPFVNGPWRKTAPLQDAVTFIGVVIVVIAGRIVRLIKGGARCRK